MYITVLFLLTAASVHAAENPLTFDDILTLNSQNFDESIKTQDTFVMFFAPWCGHCKNLKPDWEELSNKYRNSLVQIAKVDCTVETQLCTDENIRGYPTLLYYNSKTLDRVRFTGARSMQRLEEFVNERITPQENEMTYDVDSGVLVLTSKNFQTAVERGDYFVAFYAPWCSHCKALKPVWEQLAEAHNTNPLANVKIAKIDCTAHVKVCQEYEIKGYPSLLYLRDGRLVEKYDGPRELGHFTQFIERTASQTMPQQSEEGKIPTMRTVQQDGVLTLTKSTFDAVIEDHDLVFVKFYAPWCGYCKQLAPIWEQLGQGFADSHGPVRIAKVNCDEEATLCAEQGVTGYPTLRLFSKGEVVADYSGDRTVQDLVKFVNHYRQKDEL